MPRKSISGPQITDSAEDPDQYVRGTTVTYHHQVGTWKMGLDALAVVDPRTFQMHGIPGLRVADAPVMPLEPTGTTNAPTIMIAERAAAMILADSQAR